MIDARTEQLINRKLDGELAEGELLELDKLLIRCPQARALLEDYQRHDRLAVEALDAVVARQSAAAGMTESLVKSNPWRSVPRLAAACILLAVLGGLPLARQTSVVAPPVAGNAQPVMAGMNPFAGESAPPRIDGPRRQKEQIHRNVFGVFDETTRSVYLLEMDQQQTTVVPVSMSY